MRLNSFKNERITNLKEVIKAYILYKTSNHKFDTTLQEKGYILDVAKKEFCDKCKCEGKQSASEGVITDKMIELVKVFLDCNGFESLSARQKGKLFDDFITEMSDYLAIKKPKYTIINKKMVDIDLSYEYIEELLNDRTLESMEILNNNTIITFAETDASNQLYINYFSKKYFKNMEDFGISADYMKDIMGISYLVTIRHECQHLKQMLKIKNYLETGKGDNTTKLLATSEQMYVAIDKYRLRNDIDETSHYGVSYLTEYAEIDARDSEIDFMKKLLLDDRLGEMEKTKIKEYIDLTYSEIMPFVQFGEMKDFVDVSLKYTRKYYENVFKECKSAGDILRDFDSVDKEEFLREIQKIELSYIEMAEEFGFIEKDDDTEFGVLNGNDCTIYGNGEFTLVEDNDKTEKRCDEFVVANDCNIKTEPCEKLVLFEKCGETSQTKSSCKKVVKNTIKNNDNDMSM